MKIIETPLFTKRLTRVLSPGDYRALQNYLIDRPEAGKVITGSNGLRKLRWTGSGRGKRGGSRVIYYHFKDNELLMMLMIYRKNEIDNLTQDQIKILSSIVRGELG